MKEIKNNNRCGQLKRIFSKEINPKREWCIFVTIFVLSTIVFGWFSIYLYESIQPDSFFKSGNESISVSEKINLLNLDKTVLNYERISEKFKTLKKVKLVDPSL